VKALAALLLLLLALAAPLAAQDQRELQGPPAGPVYSEWERLARRAEVTLEADRASNAALEQLRAQLVTWRSSFEAAERGNDNRLATLRAQIEALGPAPAEGAEEPEEIATRRAELGRELGRLEAPGRTAAEAHSRADSLIREIDGTIRERQANELLKLGPSPLNPVNWPAAMEVITRFTLAAGNETVAAWRAPAQRAEGRESLPVVVLLLAVGLVLIVRGRSWMRRLASRATRGLSPAAKGVVDFAISPGQILLPCAGFVAVAAALSESNLFGLRGAALIDSLPGLGVAVYGARWLAGRFFPRSELGNEVLALPPERRAQGRFFATVLGLMLWTLVLHRDLAELEDWTPEVLTVLQFPVLVVAGLCLVRLGQLIGPPLPAGEHLQEDHVFRRRLGRIVGLVAVVLGIAGPVLAGIGYQSAASFLTVPTAQSLVLIALMVLLQGFATEAYALATRRSETEMTEALVPVLFGMALGIASIPLFALIWGARVSDLTEAWTQLRQGFTLGGTRVSPGMFLTFLAIFGVGYIATRLLQGTLRVVVLPKTRIDAGGQTAIVSGIGYVGIILASVTGIVATGIDLSALAIVFGALSVGIGFGLQNIVQNFISGIIMLVERPVAEGDWIEVGGKQGIVKAISVRSTRIETFDRTDVIVPNAEFISGIVTNWTRGNLNGRIIVSVGVAYGTDTRKVERILREIAEAHPLVVINPPPGISFARFGANALEFEIAAILRDVNFGGATKSDLHHEIARRFSEEGIEIPFQQRDVWLRTRDDSPRLPEVLDQPAEPPPA
jgi:potassium efflux system protein